MKTIKYGIIAAIAWYLWKRYKEGTLPTLPQSLRR